MGRLREAKRAMKGTLRRLEKRSRNRLEIVLYHFVTGEQNPFAGAGHNVAPGEFEKQLTYLQSRYEILPLEEAVIAHGEGRLGTGPVACVCFDDGYRCNLTEAYPILQKVGVPATIFVCPSILGNRDLLWRDKVRYLLDKGLEDEFLSFLKNGESAGSYRFDALKSLSFYRWTKSPKGISDMGIQEDLRRFFEAKSIAPAELAREFDLFFEPDAVHPNWEGLTFGNHTWSHPLMTLLDADSQREEILRAHEWLTNRGVDTGLLGMPFSPYNADTLSILPELGYRSLFTVSNRSNHLSRNGDARVMHRWLAPASLAEFEKLF